MMPKNLFLVRHGQSEGNKARKNHRETGSESLFTDEFLSLHESRYALTELGIEQAKKAGKWLKKNKLNHFERYYVSNNVRAMQTAAYLNLPNAQWLEHYALRERDGGLFNTMTPSQRNENYTKEQIFYDTEPFLFRPPQGESLPDVANRLKNVLDTMSRECENQNVIIVCHGHVMRIFRFLLERMSLDKVNEYLLTPENWGDVPNCSIMHYTRESESGLTTSFNKFRMIRPAGGGELEDEWKKIVRHKFSNAELLQRAEAMRKTA